MAGAVVALVLALLMPGGAGGAGGPGAAASVQASPPSGDPGPGPRGYPASEVSPAAPFAVANRPPQELRVTILHTSDEHSALLPWPLVDHRPAGAPGGGPGDGPGDATAAGPGAPPGSATHASPGGIARLATVVASVRATKAETGEPVLLTSAGDILGGTPFAWLLLEGEAPELRLMAELGYDAIALGNHEFDYGPDRLAAYLAAAGYPGAATHAAPSPAETTGHAQSSARRESAGPALLASNTRPPPDHPLARVGLRRTHLMELPNGLRVGLLGLIGRGAARFATLAEPVTFDDAVASAVAAAEALREAGAHIVVAITHAGLEEDRALARAVPAIDVILGGHDHLFLHEPAVEAGTPIVHPGAHLRHLAVLELGYDPATGRVRGRNPETGTPHVLPLDPSVAENSWMLDRLASYRALLEARIAALTGDAFATLDATVARTDATLLAGPPFAETPLGNLATDAMRWAVEAATGEAVDFAFQANGMLRTDIRPGRREGRQGDVALYDLLGVMGMGTGPDNRPGYPLVSVWLTGDEVRRVLELSVLLSELMRNSYYLQVSGLRMRYDPARAVLMRIPVRGTPIPTGRAVLAAERESEAGFVPLERGDARLYHVVTDYYVASFLPMVGGLVPRLAIEPKNRHGQPIADLDDAIVYRDGQELKAWQALLGYVTAQPPDGTGRPRIPAAYASVQNRLVAERAAPIWAWPAAVTLLMGLGAAAFLRWRRRSAA